MALNADGVLNEFLPDSDLSPFLCLLHVLGIGADAWATLAVMPLSMSCCVHFFDGKVWLHLVISCLFTRNAGYRRLSTVLFRKLFMPT